MTSREVAMETLGKEERHQEKVGGGWLKLSGKVEVR